MARALVGGPWQQQGMLHKQELLHRFFFFKFDKLKLKFEQAATDIKDSN
jgi:hypothetical protein